MVTQFAPAPILYTVRDPTLPNATLDVLYEFATITNILGIAGTSSDRFTVVVGNATADATGCIGTFSAWSIENTHAAVKAHEIVIIPESIFLNDVAGKLPPIDDERRVQQRKEKSANRLKYTLALEFYQPSTDNHSYQGQF